MDILLENFKFLPTSGRDYIMYFLENRILSILIVMGILSSCQAVPPTKDVWLNRSGRPVSPASADFRRAAIICDGERMKAAVGAPVIYYNAANIWSSLDAAIYNAQREQAIDQIGYGCMAQQGFEIVKVPIRNPKLGGKFPPKPSSSRKSKK